MKIEITNRSCTAVEISSKEEKIISRALTYEVPGHQFMPSFRKGWWDGKKRFYSKVTQTFPSGLLPFVVKLFDRQGWDIQADDKRRHSPISQSAPYQGLRNYQQREFGIVVSNKLRVGRHAYPWVRGIIKHPTRSGKTFFAGALIQALNVPTLYVVERLDLLYQTRKVLKRFVPKVGLIGEGHRTAEKVTVATVQTLKSLDTKEWLKTIGCLIVDEAHHVAKGAYHDIALACPNASVRFGFTATPLVRGDLGDIMLVADTGEIISEVSREELTEGGFIAVPTIYLHVIDEPDLKGDKWQQAYTEGIVENEYRNQIIVEEVQRAVNKTIPVLVLCRQLRHGEIIRDSLQEQGIHAIFLKGADDVKERVHVLKGFGVRVHVCIATSIFDEGVGTPEIRCVILAGGGSSRIKSIQRVGRGLGAKRDGKPNTLRVVDFMDHMNKYLKKHSEARLAAYKGEGFKVKEIRYD